jgi:hypothetical protein
MTAPPLETNVAREIGTNDRHGQQITFFGAERSVRQIRIIVDHLEISAIGLSRICAALDSIQEGLDSIRPLLGLSAVTHEP